MITAADILFDPESHTSIDPDGLDVPHVTAILSAVGVCEDFDSLAARGRRFADRIDLARHRGHAVHVDCHAYDDNDLLWNTVDDRIKPYVTAWAEARTAKNLEPFTRERQIYHPVHRYTGFLDGIFVCDKRLILVDIKTGDPASAAAHLQTAAYKAAWEVAHPEKPIDERWAIWLTPDQRVPFRVTNYTASPTAYLDQLKFLACLTTYNEQPARRRR